MSHKHNYTLFAHAGSANHGCEAIVRSTCKLLEVKNGSKLISNNTNEDIQFGIDKLIKLCPKQEIKHIKPNSIRGIINRFHSRISGIDYDIIECLQRNSNLFSKNTVALSIGGDNYCYGGIISEMRDQLKALTHWEIPTVLWGCSVSKKQMYQQVINDLKRYSLITVRETLSQQILEDKKANDNIVLCCDPAFHLDVQDTQFSFSDNSTPIIGINVSAFMGYYEAYPNATYRNFKSLIEHILKTTQYNVALIPHVVHSSNNNDLIPIRQLLSEINNDRVIAITQDYNCMQLKSLISKCMVFIGCRTHSTIAAYSTHVPALVAGYSEKAIGIARDLFGDETGLVLPVQNFVDDNSLTNAFEAFMERENELRDHLISVMPEYISRINPAINAVKVLSSSL